MIVLLATRILLMCTIILFSMPIWAQVISEQIKNSSGTDETIANDLYKRFSKGEISALEELLQLGEKGNVIRHRGTKNIICFGQNRSPGISGEGLVELNPEIYAQRVAEGDTGAVYALFNLANSMNPRALEILRNMPLNNL